MPFLHFETYTDLFYKGLFHAYNFDEQRKSCRPHVRKGDYDGISFVSIRSIRGTSKDLKMFYQALLGGWTILKWILD
jgi:hypothetical protein